jgi:hypothetical protein
MTPKEELRADRATKVLFAQLERIGISRTLQIGSDDDNWSLLIKLHTLIEASLNQLITSYLGDERLLPIITRLETGNSSTGKLAFLSALDLLSSPCRSFIKHFSELRNDLVHNVKNLEFNLDAYVAAMDKQRKKNLIDAIQTMIPEAQLADLEPRKLYFVGFAATMIFIYDAERAILPKKSSRASPRSKPKG